MMDVSRCFFRCDVRRKEAQHVVPRRSDDESLCEKLTRDFFRGAIELDAPHHAHPANLDDSRHARLEFRELLAEPRAGFVDARKQRRLLDLVEDGVAHPAGDRISAERCPVMTRLHDAFDCLAGEHRAERQSAAERFRKRDDVGNDAAVLKREQRSGASEPALDLVEDENRAGAIGESSCGRQIFGGQRNDAALA